MLCFRGTKASFRYSRIKNFLVALRWDARILLWVTAKVPAVTAAATADGWAFENLRLFLLNFHR
jgi:hypothetical protein